MRFRPGRYRSFEDLDLLVRGGSPDSADEDLLLAVEISNSIDEDDLRRAKEAAEILQQWAIGPGPWPAGAGFIPLPKPMPPGWT